jgi:cytochrome b561
MSLVNTSNSYGSIAKFFHWLIALCVVVLLVLGFIMGAFKNKALNDALYMIHKSIGLLVLLLMLLRIAWRFFNVEKQLVYLPLWQKRAARSVHELLYLILIVMPLSGWILTVSEGNAPTFFTLFTVPLPLAKDKAIADIADDTHKTLAWVILALVSLHILAALKHYFYDKDSVLQQMLPKRLRK